MRFSLSAKLTLLLLAALSCVIIPALVITYTHVGEEARRADREHFLAAIRMVEENIDAGLLHLNAAKVSGILDAKEKLRGAARRFAPLVVPPGGKDPEKDLLRALSRRFQSEYLREGMVVDVFRPEAPRLGPWTSLELSADLRDLKGQTLAKTLSGLSPAGHYGIYRLPGRGPMLAYFLPVDHGVTVAALSVQPFENEAEKAVSRLLRSLEARFEALPLHRGGFISLFDRRGKPLAGRGDLDAAGISALPPLFREALEGKELPLERVLPVPGKDGGEKEYLIAASYARPFQWFTVMGAPLEEINASSYSLLRRLALQSLGMGLFALFLSLLLLRRTVRPLRLLLPRIRALPDQDLSSPELGAALKQDLPLDRPDEVGDLARSFATMAGKLGMNIRALMESSAIQERMRGELNAAKDIQRGILPSPDLSPDIFGLSSAAMLEPAWEVGGDLYYFFTLADGRYAFVIGDVSGKGVPAALFMAITVTMARHSLTEESSPGAALTRINSLLEAHNPQSMFVTLFLALYDPASGRIDYANGGHNPPWMIRGGDIVPLEGVSGPVVGILPGLEYQSFRSILRQGELCLLYTDGVTEAADETGNFYGEDGLRRCLLACGDLSPRTLLAAIFEDVKRFRGAAAPSDDITMLAFARH
jgi:sigma-B regulation protein RsbU (phosphoserine phosphatase)